MSLTSERISPTKVVFRRRFNAPPDRIWEAHFSEHLVPLWMTGPDGWSMPSCTIDATEGGAFRFEYAHPKKGQFVIFGTYETLEPPHRSVHVEQMDLPAMLTPPTRVETLFQPDAGETLMIMTLEGETEHALDALLQSGMEAGMEITYARLDNLDA